MTPYHDRCYNWESKQESIYWQQFTVIIKI